MTQTVELNYEDDPREINADNVSYIEWRGIRYARDNFDFETPDSMGKAGIGDVGVANCIVTADGTRYKPSALVDGDKQPILPYEPDVILPVIYLCGPINGCNDAECKDWREFVKLRYGGPTLDPMRRDFRDKEHANLRELVELDKVDVANCDVLLANTPKPSYGTAMEIYIAFTTGKLVVVVTPTLEGLSPWLLYHSHAQFTGYVEALHWIMEISR